MKKHFGVINSRFSPIPGAQVVYRRAEPVTGKDVSVASRSLSEKYFILKYGVWARSAGGWVFFDVMDCRPFAVVVGLFKDPVVTECVVVGRSVAFKHYLREGSGFVLSSDLYGVPSRAYPLIVRRLVEASRKRFYRPYRKTYLKYVPPIKE